MAARKDRRFPEPPFPPLHAKAKVRLAGFSAPTHDAQRTDQRQQLRHQRSIQRASTGTLVIAPGRLPPIGVLTALELWSGTVGEFAVATLTSLPL
jgi:hypothetical protein